VAQKDAEWNETGKVTEVEAGNALDEVPEPFRSWILAGGTGETSTPSTTTTSTNATTNNNSPLQKRKSS